MSKINYKRRIGVSFMILMSSIIVFFIINNTNWVLKEEEDGFISIKPTTNESIRWKEEFCVFDLFNIEYVDEIYIGNCYAITINDNLKYFNKIKILASFNTSIRDEVRKKEEKGILCLDVEGLGDIYCLRNKTKCLRIEDDKICDLYDLE